MTAVDLTATTAELVRAVQWDADPIVAIGDREGRPLVVSHPVRSPSLAATSAHLMRFFDGDLAAGDCVICNDPFAGASHITEFTLLRLSSLGTAIVRMRLPDVGGFELGGLAPQSFDVWGEGARFPALRIAVAGTLRREALAIVTLNSRTPGLVRRGLDAMVNAADRLAGQLEGGTPAGDGSLRAAATAAGHALDELAAGTYRGEAEVEWTAADRPLVVRADLTLGNGRVALSLADSDRQLEAPINSPPAHTLDHCLGALVDHVDGFPAAPGALEGLDVDPGSGTIAGAVAPAITGLAPYLTARAIRRAVGGALCAAGGAGDIDAWWERHGRGAYEARVDPATLRVPDDEAQRLMELERGETP